MNPLVQRFAVLVAALSIASALGCGRLPSEPSAPSGTSPVSNGTSRVAAPMPQGKAAPAPSDLALPVIGPIINPIINPIVDPIVKTVDTVLTVTKPISGLVGGVVSAGSFRLDVPAGAINGDVTITMKTRGSLVHLEISPPEANGFSRPVTLTRSFPGMTERNLNQLGVFWYDPANNDWVLLDSSVSDPKAHTVSAQLEHFSTYQVANKSTGRAGW